MNPTLRAAFREFDVTTRDLLRKVRSEGTVVPCKEGCDHCCYDVAWVLAPEVAELAERVQSWRTERREKVLAAIRTWLDGMREDGFSVDERRPDLRRYHARRRPCPLLDVETQTCSVYDIRPLTCRGHYAAGTEAPAACANRAEVPSIETVQFPDACTKAVVRIAGTSSDVQRLRDQLLPRALGIALGVP